MISRAPADPDFSRSDYIGADFDISASDKFPNSHSTASRASSGIGSILWRAATARRATSPFALP